MLLVYKIDSEDYAKIKYQEDDQPIHSKANILNHTNENFRFEKFIKLMSKLDLQKYIYGVPLWRIINFLDRRPPLIFESFPLMCIIIGTIIEKFYTFAFLNIIKGRVLLTS